ncbi:MAG: hypothetical protein AAF543_15580 [Pseudomonadota bacterium]
MHAQDVAKGEDDFDIGIIIDNRPLPASEAGKDDINGLIRMLDQQMYLEHVLLLERPTIDVVCDFFGCPEEIEPTDPFPPLIWQITREGVARLVVYYIGEGRAEGLERQLLFRRDKARGGRVVSFPVSWLHWALDDVRPESVTVMLDTSFSPTPLPCADDDPHLIDDALLRVRRNYRRIAREHWNVSDNLELSATTPVQAPHCDRFDQVLKGVEKPLFTKYLVKGIVDGEADKGPFGDENRLVDLGELEDYLNDRIGQAARFQWGRLQNVRAVGGRGHVLASVDGRKLGEVNAALLERRNRTSDLEDEPTPPDDEPDEEEDEVPVAEGEPSGERQTVTGAPPSSSVDRCAADPDAPGCHPCVIAPDGEDCARHCRENSGASICARDLATATDADVFGESAPGDDEPDVVVVTREEAAALEQDVTDHEADDRSFLCDWTIDTVSPYAATLVERIIGETASACTWAGDRVEPALGPFAQVFTPIAWRLGRPLVQDTISCVLDCEGIATAAMTAEPPAVDRDVPAVVLPEPETQPLGIPQAFVDPRSLAPFQREVCDELDDPLPPYIGLPRWMPGTLIISEVLRSGYDCPPPPVEPALPVPVAVAIEAPADALGEEDAPPSDDEPSQGPIVSDAPLATWPSDTAADVNIPPEEGDVPLAGEPDAPSSAAPSPVDIDTADATPSILDIDDDQPSEVDDEPPFDGSVGQVRWLQSALTVDNRDPGPIDGRAGRKTMEAVQSWREDNGRADRTGDLTEPEFQAIIEQFGERFDQILPRVRSF